MMGSSAILHIGLGKCGSSAIQQALSSRPDFTGNKGERYAYLAINKEGRLVSSQTLQRNAARSPFQYVASADAKTLLGFDKRILRKLNRKLHDYSGRGITPILSNEGWSRFGSRFAEQFFFESLGLAPDVAIYIRPQVAWLNSAWWQWGAWTGAPFGKWVERQIPGLDWWAIIQPWLDSASNASVSVRILPSDVVSEFFGRLPAQPPQIRRTNTGLSSAVLRLMQRHPELRPSAHASALAFILERRLANIPHSGSPWVIDHRLAGRIIETCQTGNLKLLDVLGPDDRRAMLDDPCWWEKSAYAHRRVEPPDPLPVESQAVEELAVAMVRAIEDADTDLRALRGGSLQFRKLSLEGVARRIWRRRP